MVHAVLPAAAQQTGRVYRLGTFDLAQRTTRDEVGTPAYLGPSAPFFQALRELGWIEGRNLAVERRFAKSPDQLPAVAADLVRSNADVIVVLSAGLATVAHRVTKTASTTQYMFIVGERSTVPNSRPRGTD